MGGEFAKGGQILLKSRFDTHLVRGQGYVVRDERGAFLTAPEPLYAMAERVRARMQAEDMAKRKIGARPCMCCQKSFKSEGIHNRMCVTCRGASIALGDPVRPQIARRA